MSEGGERERERERERQTDRQTDRERGGEGEERECLVKLHIYTYLAVA